MLLYALICLCLALVGVSWLQFMYLVYLERLDREKKKRLHELELECRDLRQALTAAEIEIAAQRELLANTVVEADDTNEVWADVIEDS
jgi:hypothetical protein